MSVNEQSRQIAPRGIEIEYEFQQAPATVWRVLSEPKLLAQWLLPNDIEVEVGQRFSLGEQPHAIECEILASEPERLLSYSWRSGNSGGDLDTVVTFVLTQTINGGTHLRLIHNGFPQATAQIIHLPQQDLPTHKAIKTIKATKTIKVTKKSSSGEVKMLWAA